MRKYWINFSGYVAVEAENKIKAEQLFWDKFVSNVTFPFSDDVWDIDDVTLDDDVPLMETTYTQQDIEDFWNDK